MSRATTVTNRQIATLLRHEAENVEGVLAKAFRRAARSALLWPQEASELQARRKPLTELHGIGPHLSKRIAQWLKSPPTMEKPPPDEAEFLTLAEARAVLARKPTWQKRIQGDLQMHTTWSDGSASVEEMARAAAARGYHYIGITDHTKGLKIAGGINEKELARQGREIAKVNRKLAAEGIGLVVLRSTEVNLSPAGEVDMEANALAELDVVLGSFHSALRRSEDQTDRYLAALRNPGIQILGHPQCRVFGYRVGLTADWPRVFAEAARLDKAVEIDGYADRQDLRVSLLKIARREGARISLGTDAHHPWQLAFMDFSLAAAYLAKIPPERIVNFMSLADFKMWVEGVRAVRPRSPRKGMRASSK
jgi:histidinol phosphatase-like PHP family hydrolase